MPIIGALSPENQVDYAVALIFAPQMYNKGPLFLMIENSNIDEHLREAYQHSEYWLLHPQLQIKLDRSLPEVEELLIDNHSFHACLLTAQNPGSKLLEDSVNRQRQQQLIQSIQKEQLRWIAAISKDPLGKWPDEDQILILDCTKAKGLEWAGSFEQAAFLYLELGQPATLVWTKA